MLQSLCCIWEVEICVKILTLLRPISEQITAVRKIFVYELEINTDDFHGLFSSAGIVWVIETCRFRTPEMLRRVNRQRIQIEYERITTYPSVGEYLPVDNALHPRRLESSVTPL